MRKKPSLEEMWWKQHTHTFLFPLDWIVKRRRAQQNRFCVIDLRFNHLRLTYLFQILLRIFESRPLVFWDEVWLKKEFFFCVQWQQFQLFEVKKSSSQWHKDMRKIFMTEFCWAFVIAMIRANWRIFFVLTLPNQLTRMDVYVIRKLIWTRMDSPRFYANFG